MGRPFLAYYCVFVKVYVLFCQSKFRSQRLRENGETKQLLIFFSILQNTTEKIARATG